MIGAMQGLRKLYRQTGRRAEWAQLVAEVMPDFVDARSDGPLPGREDEWTIFTGYRVNLALESRNWSEAERVQRVCVDWDRKRAASVLEMPIESLDHVQRNTIRTLAVSIRELGDIQIALEQEEGVASYEESLRLAESIADRSLASVSAFNLGHAYVRPLRRDLDRAEQWYRRSLEWIDERDSRRRAQRVGQLGYVAYARFEEARGAGESEAELLRHLNAAANFYFQTLDLLPNDAVDDLLATHAQIGNIYGDVLDGDKARSYWHEAIRYAELGDNPYAAGQIRFNVASSLFGERRFADAREYALAALRNFESFGAGASEDVKKTQRLLSEIAQALQSHSTEKP